MQRKNFYKRETFLDFYGNWRTNVIIYGDIPGNISAVNFDPRKTFWDEEEEDWRTPSYLFFDSFPGCEVSRRAEAKIKEFNAEEIIRR